MGNSFEKIVCAAGGNCNEPANNWSPYRRSSHYRRNNAHSYCRQNHMQCQICKRQQQQQHLHQQQHQQQQTTCQECMNCSSCAEGLTATTLLHVSSTPNLGGGYMSYYASHAHGIC